MGLLGNQPILVRGIHNFGFVGGNVGIPRQLQVSSDPHHSLDLMVVDDGEWFNDFELRSLRIKQQFQGGLTLTQTRHFVVGIDKDAIVSKDIVAKVARK